MLMRICDKCGCKIENTNNRFIFDMDFCQSCKEKLEMVILSWIDEPESARECLDKMGESFEAIIDSVDEGKSFPRIGNLREEYLKRDEQIRAERKKGSEYKEIAAKYDLSESRIRQICMGRYRFAENSPLYPDFEWYGDIGGRICSCFIRSNIDTKEKVIKLVKTGKIKKLKGFGDACLNVVLEVYGKEISGTDRK